MHLLKQYEHTEACTQSQCAHSCDVAGFLSWLEEPLFAADVHRQEQEQKRLVALVKGEIPEAV